jgi:hypothetical protein
MSGLMASCLALAAALWLTAGAALSAEAEPAPLKHRPLRLNVEPGPPVATEPLRFDGYAGAPPFVVIPRKPELTWYPCSNCHAALKPNPQPRKLQAAPHAADLPHGNGRMWCVTCHSVDQRDQLSLLAGGRADFDRSDLVCGQCHGQRHRDWFHGGHGKRDAVWAGDRRLFACTHCHDPHNPVLQPREPQAPPPVRAGLTRRSTQEHQ